jgi:anaerobic dimethyl sulfoxide reductase subunit A
MWGLEDGWKYGEELLLMPPLTKPAYESKSDYEICRGVARRLGLERAYTEGRDEKGWIAWALERFRELRFPDAPTLEQMEKDNRGVYSIPVTQPKIAFADFRKDPEKHPLSTRSGKIEIFSTDLHELANPREIPPVPKYIQEWESPFGPEAERYPLQAIGHHTMGRVHSIHDNVDWLQEAFPQRMFINPVDAEARRLRDGDSVLVFNDRGTMILSCRITPRIMPGVVDIPQGAWWQPDESGVDRGGSINTLTSERWTPHAFATAQHTIMVQVEKA